MPAGGARPRTGGPFGLTDVPGTDQQGFGGYTGAYQDPGSVPARHVDSWSTVDLNLGYRIDGGQGWMARSQCNLGVNNLFDQATRFVNQYDLMSGNFGYDAANSSLLGRQVSLQIIKRWGR